MDVATVRRRAAAVERQVQRLMVTVAGLVLIAMTLLIAYNVVARKFFNRPVEAVIDIVQAAMMVMLVYLALAAPAHIAIRLVMRLLPGGLAAAVNTVTWLLSAMLFALGAWAAFGRAQSSRATGESTVGVTTFSIYPYRYVVALGLLAAAVHVLLAGRAWVTGFEVEKIIEEAEEKTFGAGE